MPIEVGDPVTLKPRSLSNLGIEKMVQGGRGTIADVSEDAKGTVYRVRLDRNGRIRAARAGQLVVHRKPKKRKKR
jgi:hypothetical protein